MLPDFPEIKRKTHDHIQNGAKIVSNQNMPLLGSTKKKRVFEGDKSKIVREDGSIDEVNFKTFSKEVASPTEEVEKLTLEEFFQKLCLMMIEMGNEQEKEAFQDIANVVERVGNSIKVDKKPSADDLLKVFERIHLDFDDNGKAKFPTIYTGEAGFKNFGQIMKDLEQEPFKSKFEEIINKKKAEWNARESNRKLVD